MALNRREFIKVSALAGGGFAIGCALPATRALAAEGKTFAPNQWIRITPDNFVTVVVDKSEMGQGVYTGLPMLVAEELDADWSKIRIEPAPVAKEYAHPWFGVQGTGGSTSIRAMWQPLRQAGATARAMLVAAAAETWKVAPAKLSTEYGAVIGPGGERATYGQLAAKAAGMAPPKEAPLKDPAAFKIIGKPLKRLDTPAKTNGTAKFGMDAKLPGLLTAVVVRSPVVGGKLVRFNGDKAKAIKGVKMVLPVTSPTSEGVAVLAQNYWAAKLGRDALEIEWDAGRNAALSTASLREQMSKFAESGEGALLARKEGDVAATTAAKTVEAVYEVPYLVHAPMEPMNCTAWAKPDGVELWVGSQAQGPNQMTAAMIAGCKPGDVVESSESAGESGLLQRRRYQSLLLSSDGHREVEGRAGCRRQSGVVRSDDGVRFARRRHRVRGHDHQEPHRRHVGRGAGGYSLFDRQCEGRLGEVSARRTYLVPAVGGQHAERLLQRELHRRDGSCRRKGSVRVPARAAG
jgi:isoquinoline 1-oxidoreductase beta subunit